MTKFALDTKMVITMNRPFHRSLESAMRTLALRRQKMAWIVGPRQVGKTTLAKALLTQQKAGCYSIS